MSEKEIALAEAETKAEEAHTEDENRVYEIGAHVVPSLGEEGARAEFDILRNHIMKAGATIISEEAPTLVSLSYKMQKDIDRKRFTYTTAYFGWIKFEAIPEVAHELKTFVSEAKHILRALLVKTTRETFVRQLPSSFQRAERQTTPEPVTARPMPEAPMTVEAIDAEIDKLLVE